MAGGKNDRRAKDKAMAAHLKAKGVRRTTMQCPMCHHLIAVGKMHEPAACKPRRAQYGRVRTYSTTYKAA